jgi:gliding motility-associated-like protein
VPVTTGGAVPATLFGSVTTFAGKNNTAGHIDATGTAAEFINLWGIDKDAAGNLYVADSIRVRKITPAAVVSTLAGGNPNSVSDGTGTAAGFNDIAGLAVAPSGNVFVGDLNNHVIRQITPGGAVSTFAGNGINAFNPVGVAVDQTGNIFVADQVNDLIRKFTPGAIGSIYSGGQGVAGSTNGNIASATFNNPADLEFDNSGNLFIADAGINMIREISTTGNVSTVAGNTVPGLLNGPIATARFNKPSALALDAANNIYIADSHNLLIRMINQLGQVVAVAGDNQIKLSRDGIGGAATFSNLSGLIYSNGSLFATDRTCVRKIIVTGYTIDKPLPQGLIFDSQTGIISGTPVNPSPATTYTITGYNAGGNYSTTVTITVIASIVTAPAIAYQTPQVYTTDTQISPLTPTNSGSTATGYTIDKTLPAGLTLDLATGIISGTPTVVSPATDYKITASNSDGSSSFTINITVVAKVLTPQTITFGPIPAKTYGDADFAPTASSTNNTIAVSYTSDNPAVATIVNGRIHITGAGTSNITASQPGNTDYADANPITRLLTVNKAILTVIAEDKTRVFGTFNPTLTVRYSGFVYNETAAQLTTLPTLTTTAVETSPIGDYPINVSGAASPNYIFNYAPGTLTITAVPATISIPNAFTPNGDGVNDEWNIKSLIDYPQSILSVYNRYGSLVYQSKGYPKPWDGTYHGSQVPVGTYYYIIDLKNGTSKLSGYVTVLR